MNSSKPSYKASEARLPWFSSSDTLHATGMLSKLLSAPAQIKAGFQVKVGSNDLQGFCIYKKTVNEQEA